MKPLGSSKWFPRNIIPKDQSAYCYVCGEEFVTYRGVKTVPPDPHTIRTREDIQPVAICSNPYCHEMETKRQDALFQMVIAPIREKYFADLAAKSNKTT